MRINKHQRLVVRELRRLARQIERGETHCDKIEIEKPTVVWNEGPRLECRPTGEAIISVTVLPGPSPW